MTGEDRGFWIEQRVQYAIAIIQKVTGLSALQINESAVRHLVWSGKQPSEIAQMLAAEQVYAACCRTHAES